MSREEFVEILYTQRNALVTQRNELMAASVYQDLVAVVGGIQIIDGLLAGLPAEAVEDAGDSAEEV